MSSRTMPTSLSSEQYVQSLISNKNLERALSQAAKQHERQRTLETEDHEKGLDQPRQESLDTSCKTSCTDTASRERTEHEVTDCPSRARCQICVSFKSLEGKHKRQKLVEEKQIPVIGIDCTFGTDRPRDTSTAKRTHDADESKESQKHEIDGDKMSKKKGLEARLSDVSDVLRKKSSIDLTQRHQTQSLGSRLETPRHWIRR